MKENDIAIIGLSARLPEADSVDEFLQNLRKGKDSVREISADRRIRTSLSLTEAYQLSGYIDDIDTFDHSFFNISRGEANTMAPQHRMLLQVTYQALESAGYNPMAMAGTNASVYVADTRILYSYLARIQEPMMVMGSHTSATAGRVSRFFGLRGPAAMVDTACSSALSAFNFAINDLTLGNSEVALVGCSSLLLFADRLTGDLDIGIRSHDGKTRCFSAEADGTGSGEAVIVAVLKKYDQAIKDGDFIHAIVKGMALNQVGGRSSTLTAPDAESESDVILDAWKKSGVDPETITYIEAHGTATRLGDPIEIEGIDLAFSKRTKIKKFCEISSAKSNMGHTWSAAGLVGVVKACLSLRYKQLFPNLHCARLSPLIDFQNSAVSVTTELKDWNPSCGIRRAGVSSFGVMGTNAHLILEEAQSLEKIKTQIPNTKYWIPISAKSAYSLEANIKALHTYLISHPDLDLADVQKTLVGSRGHFSHRFSVAVSDITGLTAALANPSHHKVDRILDADVLETALVFSGHCLADEKLVAHLSHFSTTFKELYESCSLQAGMSDNASIKSFSFQYAFHGMLKDLGLKFHHLIGEGIGKEVVACIRNKISIAEGIRLSQIENPESGDLNLKLNRLLDTFKNKQMIFLEAGPKAKVTALLESLQKEKKDGAGLPVYQVVAIDKTANATQEFLSNLYLASAQWAFASSGGSGRKLDLPHYQFQKIRCWLEDINPIFLSNKTVEAKAENTTTTVNFKDLDTTEEVSRIWKEILGVDDVKLTDSFFKLGGDSISGLQVFNRINDLFEVDFDISEIFEHETLGDLIDAVNAKRAATTKPGPTKSGTLEGSAYFSTSPQQLQIWLASQFVGGSVAFNLTRSFKIEGKVSIEKLQVSVAKLMHRHPSLRATFRLIDDILMQSILSEDLHETPVQTDHYDRPLTEEALLEKVRTFAYSSFDLERGPLLRVQLLQDGPNKQVLTLSTHHIVADGWSLDILIRDLDFLISGKSLPEMKINYREMFNETKEDVSLNLKSSEEYWQRQFSEIPSLLEIPVLEERGVSTFQGSYVDFKVPDLLSKKLVSFTRDQGGTHFTSFISLFTLFFSRYSDDEKVVIGTSLSERNKQNAEQLVSMLVRIVALKIDIAEDSNFSEHSAKVRSTFSEALKFRSYSYEELVQDLQRKGKMQRPHLFNVLIEYEQFGEVGKSGSLFLSEAGVKAAPYNIHLNTSVFPLNIMLSEQGNDQFWAVFRFDTSLFDKSSIVTLWNSFLQLATVLLDQPFIATEKLPLLTEGEQTRVRQLGFRSYAFDNSKFVHLEIEKHAKNFPQKVAISSHLGDISYSELNAKGNQIARQLKSKVGVGPGDLVAVLMDRTPILIQSILAIWKCGAAYLPIDPCYPTPFIISMLQTAKVNTVLFDEMQLGKSTISLLGKDKAVRFIAIGQGFATDEATSNLDIRIHAEPLAYVIYTSGSTGVPKGAKIEHLGMLNHLYSKVLDLQLTEESVVSYNAPSSFDISVWQMFSALFVGGKTIVYSPKIQLDPLSFFENLKSSQVTILEVVPSYLNTFLDSLEYAGFQRPKSSLQYLLVTGEEILPKLVNRWFKHFPDVPMVNAYGPTEASDDITHHLITAPIDSGSVPIGKPIPNTFIYLLDGKKRVVPEGSVGDIYVSGICVGQGYLYDDEQTKKVFSKDPFENDRKLYRTGDRGRWTSEGNLEFYGRKDLQVKVRGFRIDIGEVERRLSECPDVKSAAVSTTKDAKDLLLAYVVLQPAGNVESCRTFLAERLPPFMVPSHFIEMEMLPLTTNGKVDRKKLALLPVPQFSSSGNKKLDAIAALNLDTTFGKVVKDLLEIWAEVLNRKNIGLDDRFFDIGGNSLRAIQVLSRLRKKLNVDMTLETLFQHTTLSALAAAVINSRPADVEQIFSIGGAGSFPLSPNQETLFNVDQSYLVRSAFNRNDFLEIRGVIDVEALKKAFVKLVHRHESLRTTFKKEASNVLQVVHAAENWPVPFSVHNFKSEGELKTFAEKRIVEPFAINKESLFRADLLLSSSGQQALLVSIHQLICDGRSVQIFFENLFFFYYELVNQSGVTLPPISLQYKDIACWLAKSLTPEVVAWHQDYWRTRLNGATHVVPVYRDKSRPDSATFEAGRITFEVPDSVSEKTRSLTQRLNVTHFTFAHTAVCLLLMNSTGQTDVTIGTYTRGRSRLEFENQIGLFINTVPLRLKLQSKESLNELIVRSQKEILESFRYQDYPYGRTMVDLGWKRELNRSPIFDVMVAFDEIEDLPVKASKSALRLESQPLSPRSKEADLLFAFRKAEGRLKIILTYNADVFSSELAESYLKKLIKIVSMMAGESTIAAVLEMTAISKNS